MDPLSRIPNNEVLTPEINLNFPCVPGCYSLPTDMDKGYPEFGYYLNKTGRPMLYACSWPVYQTYSGMTVSARLFVLAVFSIYQEVDT